MRCTGISPTRRMGLRPPPPPPQNTAAATRRSAPAPAFYCQLHAAAETGNCLGTAPQSASVLRRARRSRIPRGAMRMARTRPLQLPRPVFKFDDRRSRKSSRTSSVRHCLHTTLRPAVVYVYVYVYASARRPVAHLSPVVCLASRSILLYSKCTCTCRVLYCI